MNKARRKFLFNAGCAAIGGSTFMSTLLNLNSINASAGYNNTDYKALVCILLAGGNDSYNMLVPIGTDEYLEYSTVRGGLALNNSEILTLNNGFNNGRELGLHPAMENIRTLYNDGKATFIANIGSLVEPVNMQEYNSGSKSVPLGLFSHVDQISHWQTAIPQERSSIGWGGRMADLLSTVNSNQDISMSISLAGSNLFQTGNMIRPFTLTEHGNIGINGYNGMSLFDQIRTSSLDSLLGRHYNNLFDKTYNDILFKSNNANLVYEQALGLTIPLQTEFTQEYLLSRQLEVVAKTISARNLLNVSRQIFFINYGGWDHHDEVLNTQANMLSILDTGLSEFYTAMDELGVANDVTTFSISDFGRTLTSNGNGSDHAWGGNAIVMGGDINGGQIFGNYPDLFLGNSLDLGRGRLIPTTSADEYFAELGLWFGVPKSELDMILPNINNFIDLNSSIAPIGFLVS